MYRWTQKRERDAQREATRLARAARPLGGGAQLLTVWCGGREFRAPCTASMRDKLLPMVKRLMEECDV